MKYLFVFLSFFYASDVIAQNDFDFYLNQLNLKLNYKEIDGTRGTSQAPDNSLIKRFENCSEFKSISALAELNFNWIRKTEITSLKTDKWKGPTNIQFQEWTFESEQKALEFLKILESVPHHQVQDFVNKGGIMWWKNENKIYVITSPAYYMTYHYEDIREALSIE